MDAELESHIHDCGKLTIAAMTRFYDTGNDADRVEARIWLDLMVLAIKSRSPVKIASMEAARGLR